MLVLGRLENERIFIGDDIVITVVDIAKGRVRIGVEAPDNVQVLRDNAKECKPRSTEDDGGR